MANPAHRHLAPPTAPKTPREPLLVELSLSVLRLAQLVPNWDGEGGLAPTKEVIEAASRLAIKIALSPSEPPVAALNMAATSDGRILFSLYGINGRQADVYVADASGMFEFVTDEGSGRLPSAAFMKLTEWLAGRKNDIESVE